MAILGGVANVIAGGADDFGKTLAKTAYDFLRVIQAEGCLREKGELIWIFDLQRVHSGDRIDNEGSVGSFAGGANDFLVILVADQNDGALFTGKLEGLEMNFGDQRAGGINYPERPILGFLANGGGNAVGAEDQDGIGRDLFDRFDENCTATAELFDDIGVVHDFMVHIDRGAVGFERELHNVDCANDSGAEPAGTHTEQGFVSVWVAI